MNDMKRSSKITLIVIGAIIFLAGLYTYSVTQKNAQSTLNNSDAGASLAVKEGESAYTDMEGGQIAINENLGKILVVNSWASWCPACAGELPDLAKLGQEFSDKNVKVLAINRAEPRTTAVAFLSGLNAVDGLQLVLDPDDKFYTTNDGYAMPETIFYDPKGNIIFHQHGRMSYEEMKTRTESIVSQSAVQNN